MKNEKNKIDKHMALYMSLGMCFATLVTLILSSIFPTDNMLLYFGLPLGLFAGMCLGMLIGQEKDKRLSKNIMIIKKIETLNDSTDTIIHVTDKNEEEKLFRVTEKKMKQERFVEGDRVAEELDGSLVSLESK